MTIRAVLSEQLQPQHVQVDAAFAGRGTHALGQLEGVAGQLRRQHERHGGASQGLANARADAIRKRHVTQRPLCKKATPHLRLAAKMSIDLPRQTGDASFRRGKGRAY